MSTWALLLGELQWFSEHEKAIWPFRAESWNIPKSPRQCLITTRSRTASGLPGGFCCSISSLQYFFSPGLSSHWISETSLLARKFLISSFALFFFKKYVFAWLHWVLVAARRSSVPVHGLSGCGAWALEVSACGPCRYDTWFSRPVACGILVPQLGVKPESPALHGGLLATDWTAREVSPSCFLSLAPRCCLP